MGKGKDALFEALKLDLYKPKADCLSFRTSEANIGVWIQHLYRRYVKELPEDLNFTWREQDRYECPSRAEKLIIHVHKKGTGACVDEQLFVITVSLSTGLIMIQSKHYKHWAAVEFPQLLAAVQNMNCVSTEECDERTTTSGLHKFCYIIFGTPKQTLASSSVEISEKQRSDFAPTSTPLKDKMEPTNKIPGINQSASQSETMSPSRVRTIRRIQEKVSNLDRDLAEMRMNWEQTSDQFESLITEAEMKEHIMKVEQNTKVYHAQHLDKQSLESSMHHLTSLVKKLEQKQQSLSTT